MNRKDEKDTQQNIKEAINNNKKKTESCVELLKDACKKQKRQNKPLINKEADPVRELNRKSVEFAFQIFLLSADPDRSPLDTGSKENRAKILMPSLC